MRRFKGNIVAVGPKITEIVLRRNGEHITALIDSEDWPRVQVCGVRTWCSTVKNNVTYVVGRHLEASRLVYLHHVVMPHVQPPLLVDHRDGNGLDNRKSNLRPASRTLNGLNRVRPAKHCQSGMRGVAKQKHGRSWYAYLKIDGKRIQIKCPTKEAAAATVEKLLTAHGIK